MRSEISGYSSRTRRANRPENTALTVGTSPRMTRPDGLPLADCRSSRTCSIWRTRPVVRSSSIRPALVSSMPRPLRTNSSTRSSCSSSLMWRLSAGWAARSRSAALLRLPSSATARKVRSCLRSIRYLEVIFSSLVFPGSLLDRLRNRLFDRRRGLGRMAHRSRVAVGGVVGGNLQPAGRGRGLLHGVLRDQLESGLGLAVLRLGSETCISVAPAFGGRHQGLELLLRKLPDYDIQIGVRHSLFSNCLPGISCARLCNCRGSIAN